MAQEEQVLVVETRVVEQVGMFQGLVFDVDRYLDRFFVPGVPRFMPRSQAEKDPGHKQLIPYVIMTCNGKYLSYVRGQRAGEKRLLGRRSIGIGGHINPTDDMPLFADFRETYRTAVEREVAEEVNVEAGHKDHVVALLNDDSTEVGTVHLGIVHLWILDAPQVSKREQMITQMAFLTPAELEAVRDTMETWSQLCLDGLAEMTKRME
jgi:predicted NUDIX family phosphoesterase